MAGGSLRESTEQRKRRARRVLARLRQAYPNADCELEHRDPFQLLIATILSAQTTDRAVNKVTPALFRHYGSPEALAAAEQAHIESLIASIGLYRNKARSVVGAARAIVERFGGEVPRDREELESLPGVGRKTANVVLPNAFGVPGLAVDTHVARLAGRLALSGASDPRGIERDLTALYPEKSWAFVSHALIWHGRRVCDARRPRCDDCVVAAECPAAFAGPVAFTAGERDDSERRRTRSAKTRSRRTK